MSLKRKGMPEGETWGRERLGASFRNAYNYTPHDGAAALAEFRAKQAMWQEQADFVLARLEPGEVHPHDVARLVRDMLQPAPGEFVGGVVVRVLIALGDQKRLKSTPLPTY